MLTSFFFHIWFDVGLRGRVVVRCTLFAVVNARWTTSNQMLLVLEPKIVGAGANGCWCWNQKLLVLEPKIVGAGTNGCWCWNQKLLVLEPHGIKNTKRAKRLLIPPVCSLRGIRAYYELQMVVTEVGQVKRTVIKLTFYETFPEELTICTYLKQRKY